jgi:hypothetical protein
MTPDKAHVIAVTMINFVDTNHENYDYTKYGKAYLYRHDSAVGTPSYSVYSDGHGGEDLERDKAIELLADVLMGKVSK